MSAEKIIHTTGINNCGGRCILHAHVRDGEIVRLSTDSASAAGEIPLCACAKGLNCHKTFLGPDRLTTPLRRVGERGEGSFVPISWDEALDIVAREWKRIRDTYGPASRFVMYATGVSAVLEPSAMAKRLLNLDGGYLAGYNSYSSACISQVSDLMYGTRTTGNHPSSWPDSGLIILWGHNPADTKFDSMTMHYLQRAKAKGVPIICIDPRRSNTAKRLGAEWIPLRPASDAALMDAMAYTIYTEKLHDQSFLDRCCIGFDKAHMPKGADPDMCVLSYLLGELDGVPKTPRWAETITGVPADTIRSLARRYAMAKPAALIEGLGAQRHNYGEQSARGAILLACMTGNVGVWGGWSGGRGMVEGHQQPSFPKGENPVGLSIPNYLWTEAVLRGREMTAYDGVKGGERLPSDIKMLVNLAGNCLINQHGDINKTAEILRDTSKCEFILCSDLFMTASAKFADILLPGVSLFETENMTMPWQYGDFLGFANKAVEPIGQSRFEYDWLRELAQRLGHGEAFSRGRSAGQWLEHIYDGLRERERELPPYEAFKAAGIYRYRENKPFVAFSDSVRDPENHPFPTASGKIELFSERLITAPLRESFPPIPGYVPPPEGPQDPLREKYPLQLIGWHSDRRAHSIHEHNTALEHLEPTRIWLHPRDAVVRGLTEGDLAEIWNERGTVRIPVHITEDILPGVAAMAQGAWCSPDESGTDLGGCINTLTSLRPTPYARGNGQHTNLVQVKKFVTAG